MMPSRNTGRSANRTPARARAGVPIALCSAMPMTIARMSGLNMPMPGTWRRPNDAAAMAPVSNRPGRMP